MSISSCRRATIVLAGVAMLVSTPGAGAQPSPWRVIELHPPGAGSSDAVGVWGGQQVGYANIGFYPSAIVWEGTAGSWRELPSGIPESYALGIQDGRVVGSYGGGAAGAYRALLWEGPEPVDLTPGGARSAEAFSIDGDQQVGYVRFGLEPEAALWRGTAASWMSLHPSGATQSTATGVHAERQVGYAEVGGNHHASLWSGGPASWIDLHPEGAIESWANGVYGEEQVGTVRIGGTWRASLWRGSREWVDLTPPAAQGSTGVRIYDGRQVGTATVLGVARAALWSGTPESWEDLGAVLGTEWEASWAHAVWSDETTIYVVGGGRRPGSRNQALMWTRPIELTCYADCDGSGELDFFDFLCFQNWFATGAIGADCDSSGSLDYFDFLCYQNAFAAGCP